MKLSRLIDAHKKFAADGLPGSFGDGFLISENRVFRSVRTQALALGYRFSSERNEAYEAFPLLQLETVLQKKTLPYSNNFAPFEKMPAAALDALTWEDIDGNLKKNFVFHEAAHAIARNLAARFLKPASGQQGICLRMLLEESCANACELLGVTEAADQVHRYFYEMNSYVCEFESRTNLKNAMNEIGADLIAKFMVLSYLQANFLRTSIDDRQMRLMVALCTEKSLTPAQLKTLRAVGKVAFNLSERFREQTTSFHLRLNGITTPAHELFNFDFLAALSEDPGFGKFLSGFASLVEL